MNKTTAYNPLNLPARIFTDEGCDNDFYDITYVYSIDGVKLQQIVSADGQTNSTDYYGPLVFENGELKKIRHNYGQLRDIRGEFESIFHIADHLGSPRVVFWDENGDGEITENEVLERIDFYPFGLEHGRPVDQPEDMDTHFRYTGQEHGPAGLPYYDYISRMYDPALGRFLRVDPLAELAPAWTPYRYGFNNPLIYIDPDGLFESKREARQYRRESTSLRWWNSSIEKNDQGTFDIRAQGKDSNSSWRINRNNEGEIVYSASAAPFEGGGLFGSVKNWFSNRFKHGEQQQSTAGENWYLYGDGSPSGWEIPGPHANPDGENRSIDISDMFPPGGGVNDLGSGTLNPIGGLNDFYNVVNSLKDRFSSYSQVPRNDTIFNCEACGKSYRDSSGIKLPTTPDSTKPQKLIKTHY